MKLLKKTKKGFTLVELVVVIAVVAILSGVGVGTYIAVTNNAKKSSDQQVLDQVNKCLMVHENLPTGGKPQTMQETLDVLDAEMGVADVQKLLTNTFSGYSFAWDKPQDRFVILEGDNIAYKDANYPSNRTYSGNENDFWKMVSTVDSNALCSQYVTGTTYPDEEVTVKAGLDLGHNLGITRVNYAREGATDSKDVVIRTNGGSLSIDAKKDTIKHYNNADIVIIKSVAESSFHEFGTVSYAELSGGNFVLEENAALNTLHLKANNNKFENADGLKISIDLSKASMIPEFSRDGVDIDQSNGTLVAKVTTTKSDYIWLTKTGVIERVTLSDSKTEPKTSYAQMTDANYGVALDIANTAKRNADGHLVGEDGVTEVEPEQAVITGNGSVGFTEVTNYAELTTAIAVKANYIRFKNDIIDIPNKGSVNVNCSTIIDGNGYKLTHDGGESSGNYAVVEIGADDISVKFLNLTIVNPRYRGICNCYARVNMEVSNCTIDSWFNIVFRNDQGKDPHSEYCTLLITNSVLSLNQIYAGESNGAVCIQANGYYHKITVRNSIFNTNASKPKSEAGIIGGSDYKSGTSYISNMGNCEFVLDKCTVNLFGDNTWFYYFDCNDITDTNSVIAKNCKFTEMGGSALFTNPYAFNYPVTFDHCNFSMDVSSVTETKGTYPTPLHFEKNSDGTWSSK